MIPYGRQTITDEDIEAVVAALKSDFLTQGPRVELFEKQICEFLGSHHALAVTNGTAALHLAALALGVKPGQKVLCATNSFVASSNCIEYCGAELEFVDICRENYCLDLGQLEDKLKSHPAGSYAGVVAVDFAGFPLRMDLLRKLCDQFGLWIIEDACHAFGASFLNEHNEWVKCGSGRYADLSVFSFHPVKHIATGEGGAITTNSRLLNEKLRDLRSHGITRDPDKLTKVDGPWYYEMQMLGFNYRISDILCALGTSQMGRIDTNLARRRQIAQRYVNDLSSLPLTLPQSSESEQHAYHLFVIQTDRRDELYRYLREREIFAQVHYIPIHTQPYYVDKYGAQTLPNAENYYRRALSLPMYPGLSDQDQAKVIIAIRDFFRSSL